MRAHVYTHTHIYIHYIHTSMDGWMDRGRVFEDKLLRKMFGLKRDEVTVV